MGCTTYNAIGQKIKKFMHPHVAQQCRILPRARCSYMPSPCRRTDPTCAQNALRMRHFVTFCAMLESQNLIINQLIQIHLPEHGAHTSPYAPYGRPSQRRRSTRKKAYFPRSRGSLCVPAGVVRRYTGESGQRHSPPPGAMWPGVRETRTGRVARPPRLTIPRQISQRRIHPIAPSSVMPPGMRHAPLLSVIPQRPRSARRAVLAE